MEQELQSHLLRLSILLATSLSTLSEPIAPTIVADSSTTSDSTSADLANQIHSDLQALITSVQKSCTNLTLALRPNTNARHSNALPQSTPAVSPIGGLDTASLEAAKAQVVSITNDSVPKLVFLARKATSEATVYRYVAKSAEDRASEAAERALVQSKGGYVVLPPHAREMEKLEKIKGRGLGKAWSKAIVATVFGLFEALGELSRAYMDARTRSVLQKAQEARNKADGIVNGSGGNVSTESLPKDSKQARQLALQATGVVWEICDAALKGNRKLVADNRSAVCASWKRRTEVLKDALRELDEALEDDKGGDETQRGDDEDALDDLGEMQLSGDERRQAQKHVPLLKNCCQLHAKAGATFLGPSVVRESPVDLDDLDQAGEAISEGVDDLVSTLLYGRELNEDDRNDAEKGEDDAELEVRESVEQVIGAARQLYAEAVMNATPSMLQIFDEQWNAIRESATQLGYTDNEHDV